MDKQMKECLKPHALLHIVTGIGLGIILTNWMASLYGQTGMIIGLFVVLASFLGELYLAGGHKK